MGSVVAAVFLSRAPLHRGFWPDLWPSPFRAVLADVSKLFGACARSNCGRASRSQARIFSRCLWGWRGLVLSGKSGVMPVVVSHVPWRGHRCVSVCPVAG